MTITGVEFLPHPNLFRAIFPEHDIRVPQRDPGGFVKILGGLFPDEREGIAGLFDDMRGLSRDVQRLSGVRGQPDMSRFPLDFPHLYKFYNKTWGEMAGTRIKDARLKAIVSAQWGYFGLPPSKLSCFYYVLPFMGYLSGGGYYPRRRSQDISDALAAFVRSRGGTILLNTKVEKITVAPHGVDNYCCGGGSGFALMSAHGFEEWRVTVAGRMKLRQVLDAFSDQPDPEVKKYVCAPCSNCKGQLRDIFRRHRVWEKSGILYGGLAQLIANAMEDLKQPFIQWEFH